ncbi:sigma-70 family RNA polymerase sigma factor [Agromyces sp. H66]|uniref:RNA polymerase sigma factor n=1 Tax=Agromyces sp. H66 TaxID=2529859 RepID=UPI0010A99FA8|nr:sigma-70 family RNA polymerase sigma factor [Agromyces sp. H66]
MSARSRTAAERLTNLHDRLAADLLRYFVRRTEQPADAADLLGEVFLVAWRRIRHIPADDDEARLWIYGVAHRVHLNWLRGRRRAIRLAEPLRAELLRSAALSSRDEDLEVHQAVASLPPDQRELIRLVYWDGFPVPVAAGVLRIPTSTARGRLERAKRRLRSQLEEPSENRPPRAVTGPRGRPTTTDEVTA